ncbi:YciK family oxidoreductase [Aestuariibacter halophilus]|uniref:YciK family oxidoreductase n=1 Tax=Fluctibacter halophilus TaxID=226011 RepID=A0ABS8G4L3_9ALTE|nr:YciK family oxidoreductase [Aestuariibacter halophilus]MCC2615500.1 YciK family oxidoreductase [Aestuariibacter halophilus]
MLNDSPTPHFLKEHVILVTGAGDGIGRAAALAYAQHGATVILLGKTTEKLEAVYDEIVAQGYPEPAIVPLNLLGATPQHYRDMANTIEQQFGRLDGVLHNASTLGHLEPLKNISETDWQTVMQVNLNSTFYMTQALLPLLEKANRGVLLFTTSTVGSQGRAYWGTYAISKFATEGMMQVLADEYANHPLTVNGINPGATRTNMRASAYPAEDPEKLKTPEDLMPVYLYAMSPECKEHGQVLVAQPK